MKGVVRCLRVRYCFVVSSASGDFPCAVLHSTGHCSPVGKFGAVMDLIQCVWCLLRFATEEALSQHIRVNTVRWRCKICYDMFTGLNAARMHCQRVHVEFQNGCLEHFVGERSACVGLSQKDMPVSCDVSDAAILSTDDDVVCPDSAEACIVCDVDDGRTLCSPDVDLCNAEVCDDGPRSKRRRLKLNSVAPFVAIAGCAGGSSSANVAMLRHEYPLDLSRTASKTVTEVCSSERFLFSKRRRLSVDSALPQTCVVDRCAAGELQAEVRRGSAVICGLFALENSVAEAREECRCLFDRLEVARATLEMREASLSALREELMVFPAEVQAAVARAFVVPH